jgi:hypothetical protein
LTFFCFDVNEIAGTVWEKNLKILTEAKMPEADAMNQR